MYVLAQKVWFITGASSGLGLAMLEHVLAQGDMVAATLRKPEALSDVAKRVPSSKILIIQLDVTKPQEVIDAFAQAYKKFGRIDIVYNNAAYGILGEIECAPDEHAREVFEVNFWGTMNVSKEAVKYFRDFNKPPGGRLIQVSSMGGVVGWPGLGYYSASKAAFQTISESLFAELSPEWNIKITIVTLGGFNTRATNPGGFFRTPAHPAYDASATATTRSYFNGERKMSSPESGAREIYNIARDSEAPLHVILGDDAKAVAQGKLDHFAEYLDCSKKWSIDLSK